MSFMKCERCGMLIRKVARRRYCRPCSADTRAEARREADGSK